MADVLPMPRKRRTRAHIITDLGVNHVERLVFEAGHVAQRVLYDYGYDLTVATYDAHGNSEPDRILIQVKASDRPRLSAAGTHYTYDIDVAHYNLWTTESDPVFIILYEAPARRAYWLYVQQFFQQNPSRAPRPNARFVRVLIPRRQRLNARAIAFFRQCKENITNQTQGVIVHG